ncbi:MAG: shikimate dehydrogenase [Chloroflexota bacterium]|nr:shikimate dehydrogenase [Chloroflexota bacterium]
MTRLLGIIGYPLGHSLSPVFQQAALDALRLDVRYERWETPPESLAERLRSLRQLDVLGANVTVPHKEAVIPLLDSVDEWARTVGAVNTIVSRDGSLTGYNTDSVGFLQGLAEASFNPRGVSVLLLGAGGAARGVALALAREGVASIAIANRTVQRAQALAETVARHGPRAEALPLDGAALREAARRSQLIVNTTTLGMLHSAGGSASPRLGPGASPRLGPGASPLPAAWISASALVYDLVYNPLETPLLREAKRAGARTQGGLAMLLHQGVAAFVLWTGRDAPVDVMRSALRQALAR